MSERVRWNRRLSQILPLFGMALALASHVEAADLRIAVSANFRQTLQKLCEEFFATRDGGRCIITSGSSGLLYAQIVQGAPFDLFFSADRFRPERLEDAGYGVAGTRLTYAFGLLVFWNPAGAGSDDLREALASSPVTTLALANPSTAPYGAAAIAALKELGIDAGKRYRLAVGESVAQAFQFVASGAADAGFVSRAQILDFAARSPSLPAGTALLVDEGLYEPIDQQAVLLSGAANPVDARVFLAFLQSPLAATIIEASGYRMPGP